MLTRIYIDNFRSFVNFEYRPERKQLLLGKNGSGKSSLLEAIRFIQRFVEGTENPFTQSTRTRWQDRPLQVMEVEARLDSKIYEYRVEIGYSPKAEQVSVKLESLNVSGDPVFQLTEGKVHLFQSNSSQPASVPFQTAESALRLFLSSNSHIRQFVEWLDSVHCFDIDAYAGKMDETADREERLPDYELENLAGWYRYLVQAHPIENAAFLESLKQALNGFRALRLSSDEVGVRKLRADFGDSANKAVYSLSELSDGQRKLIGLYMILHFEIARGKTVFIDEPDNFLALREIQPWLQLAEEAVDDHNAQLILVSHHPEILNQWAVDYGLRFFREENGQVRTERFKADPNLQPSELMARGWEDE